MKKRILAVLLILVLALGMTVGLVACNQTPTITIWVSELAGVKELTLQQVADFKAANPDFPYDVKVEGVGEGEAATQMIADVATGADIFCFAQDQLARLVQAGALDKPGQQAQATLIANNDAASVAASKVGNDIYCYPITSDNGYFMFYDKSVVAAEHIDSLEDIIADCVAANKKFSFELEGSAWYTASFFFAKDSDGTPLCVSEWTTHASIPGKFASLNDTFNSDNGIIALTGMKKLLNSPAYNNSSAADQFSAAVPSAVVISGTWASAAVKEALGDNYGVADLPSFTVDGESYHLGSFSGNKLMGVKPQSDPAKAAWLHKLATYLSNEECQNARFEEFGWGPSNRAAQATDAVQNDPALVALAQQGAYAVPQGQIHGGWWDVAKVIATGAKDAADVAALEGVLANYDSSCEFLLNLTEEQMNAWTVIGGVGGTTWNTDFEMEETSTGVWITVDEFDFVGGEEFKIRKGLSWSAAIGAMGEDGQGNVGGNEPNFVVPADTTGTFKIQVTFNSDYTKGSIELIPVEA